LTNLISDSERFCSALRSSDVGTLARIPKSDLHSHSILGTRIERVESWLQKPLDRPPTRMASLDEMIKYAHEILYPHIDTLAGFRFTAQSALEGAIADGVTVLEMSLDVRFSLLFAGGPDEFLGFVASLVETYKDRIDFRPEIGMSKDRYSADQIRLASFYIHSGIFRSIDLYGNETIQPPDLYQNTYIEARRCGLKLKAHAGEFAGPEYIARTLDVLQVDEVQHGISAATSKPLMERLKRERIQLNVCPSSNVALGIVREIGQHPIRVLVDNGVRVTINSDDLMIFGKSVSQEYLLLYGSSLLTANELDAIRNEGLSA
jgi:adenosine deaminase